MRKLLAAIVAILLYCSTIFAQSTKEKTKLGFKGGLNISGFRTAVRYPYIEQHSKAGLVLGAFVHIPLSSHFSLQPEFLYSQMGSISKSLLWGGGGHYTFRYNYFSVPVLVKYKITKCFNVFAGGEADFLLRATQKGSPSKTITYKIEDFDFAYTAGIGTSSKQWTFDLRYIHGSRDVSAASDVTTFFNQAVQATIGYQLNKKAKKTKKSK
jgi:Outer membrane protein beta-barrel domain